MAVIFNTFQDEVEHLRQTCEAFGCTLEIKQKNAPNESAETAQTLGDLKKKEAVNE